MKNHILKAYKSVFTDYETAVFNRAYVDVVLAQKYEANKKLGCLFIGVDNLQEYQNRYGRPGASTIIRKTADQLRSVLPFVSRYSGNEFVALLPGCNGNLLDWGDLARLAVSMSPVVIGRDAIKQTVTIGAASRLPGETIENLIVRADAAALRGKQKTNCVMIARPPYGGAA